MAGGPYIDPSPPAEVVRRLQAQFPDAISLIPALTVKKSLGQTYQPFDRLRAFGSFLKSTRWCALNVVES